MSDPAVAAADRAAEAGRLAPGLMIPSESNHEFGVRAAREALTPLREWHGRMSSLVVLAVPRDAAMLRELLDQIAPLIYSEEEL